MFDGSEDKTICVWGTKCEHSSHPGWAGVVHLQEEMEGGRGKKQKQFPIFFLTNDILFFSPFVLLPESSPSPHIHLPLLMTRVGKFLQTNPSSWVSRCSVSCQRTLLTTAWGIQPIQLMSSYWRRDVPSIETLFFFCLHFLQKGKKKPQIGKRKKKKKNLFPCSRARLCMSVL